MPTCCKSPRGRQIRNNPICRLVDLLKTALRAWPDYEELVLDQALERRSRVLLLEALEGMFEDCVELERPPLGIVGILAPFCSLCLPRMLACSAESCFGNFELGLHLRMLVGVRLCQETRCVWS